MHRPLSIVAVIAFVAMSPGCDQGPKSAKGFRLPDGDIAKGKAVFIALKCNTCHKVTGVDLPAPSGQAEVVVTLGGEVHRVRTYGELVTAIINPSHTLAVGYPKEEVARDGVSKMTNFNESMTVSQLIDLVAFLQSRYKEVHPQWSDDTFMGP